MKTKQVNKSEHLHISGCRSGAKESKLLFVEKRPTFIHISTLKYVTLCGQTAGVTEYSRFPDLNKKIQEKVKARLNLQTSGYTISYVRKIQDKQVFNNFRVFDREAEDFYNGQQRIIKDAQEAIQDYFKDRFQQLPFLEYADVKREMQLNEKQLELLQKLENELNIQER